MSKYRFKTEEEFKAEGLWESRTGNPSKWNDQGKMNYQLGQPIDDKHVSYMEKHGSFKCDKDWVYRQQDYVLNKVEVQLSLEEILKQVTPITKEKKKMKRSTKNSVKSAEKFVFMDKTSSILEIGYSTCKNIVLYGPGGHGKSEMTLEFLKEKGIVPYVITMGTGMTTDRLFGGMDIPTFEKTGKIEYLVENSFMNHEYVVFEEMFDAPDFILEQLKDILSSGIFRNGTQIFHIKTKFIICCTNRTRDEFSKNMSLRALMERFPLELNVIWDNYTEISYNKLLESKFGVDNVDPVIPYLLQEYAKNGITISPRIAVTAYQVYDQCGPDSLSFIAEFAKKPSLISEVIKKFEATIKFRELSTGMNELIDKINGLSLNTTADEKVYKGSLKDLTNMITDIKGLTVSDDIASMHAQLIKAATQAKDKFTKTLQITSFL
jgi:hypothetical protein